MTFCLILSPSPDVTRPCFKNLRLMSEQLLVAKTYTRVSCFNKKDHLHVLKYHAGGVAIPRPLMPKHLQESFIGEKHLKEEASLKFRFVRTLLIDNYDSYTYNIYQELSIINGVPPVVVHNDEWTWDEIRHHIYDKKAFDNIVISPGPGTPTCPADIGICLRILLECEDIPILGVCLGHQALGYAHGARIVHAPEPVHGRLSEIEHNWCSLFHGIPSGRNSGFKVVRYHSLAIDADSLPVEIIPIAWTSSVDTLSFLKAQDNDSILDAFGSRTGRQASFECFATNVSSSNSYGGNKDRRVIMGIMHSTRPHYGVQFHPESIATCHGRQIFENFRKMTVEYWLRSSSNKERKVPLANLQQHPQIKIFVNNYNTQNSSDMCKSVIAHESTGPRFLKLKWKKFDGLASDIGGAKNIFCKLFGDQKADNTFWLDSSSLEQKRARFSFMGGKGGSLWKQVTYRLSDNSDKTTRGGGYLSIEDAQGYVKSTYIEDGFLDFLNKELQSFHYEKEDYEGLPFEFCGGYIGYIGYNLKVECGVTSNRHKSRTPDACFFFADNLVVIDHHYNDVYIMAVNNILQSGITEPSESSSETSWLTYTEQRLLALKASDCRRHKERTSGPTTSTSCKAGFLADKSKDQYVKDVNNCLKFIKEGESYELCLTTQMRKRIGEVDSLGLYLKLRERNPAPYAAWLNFSKENLCICCSSPERFLQLDGKGILEAKPIKGTIARGLTPEEDRQLKLQLQHSEKDQAENLMIVDLLRNDLGRVCEPGSVYVPHLIEVESYTTVHTLVSTIRGKKKSNLSPVDCIKATFPGGSMTGAPKLRSMELLDSLETCSRGIYSGSIGFFSYNQTFDLNIVIRTVVIHEGEASIGAGGAVVALSNPEDEYQEMILKTQAPMKAVMEYEGGSDSNY